MYIYVQKPISFSDMLVVRGGKKTIFIKFSEIKPFQTFRHLSCQISNFFDD